MKSPSNSPVEPVTTERCLIVPGFPGEDVFLGRLLIGQIYWHGPHGCWIAQNSDRAFYDFPTREAAIAQLCDAHFSPNP